MILKGWVKKVDVEYDYDNKPKYVAQIVFESSGNGSQSLVHAGYQLWVDEATGLEILKQLGMKRKTAVKLEVGGNT